MCQPLLLCWKQQTKTRPHGKQKKKTQAWIKNKRCVFESSFLLVYNYCHIKLWCNAPCVNVMAPPCGVKEDFYLSWYSPAHFTELSSVIIFYIGPFFLHQFFFKWLTSLMSQCLTSRGQQIIKYKGCVPDLNTILILLVLQ